MQYALLLVGEVLLFEHLLDDLIDRARTAQRAHRFDRGPLQLRVIGYHCLCHAEQVYLNRRARGIAGEPQADGEGNYDGSPGRQPWRVPTLASG